MILQHDKPDDFVISTGKEHTVREFVEKAAKLLGFEIVWKGNGINEVGIDIKTNKEIIAIDEKYYRPSEVQTLLGDSSKAQKELGWSPETSFDELVEEMIDYDLKLAKQEMSTDKSFSYF
jgi:GDP-D-mannose dehydratase